MFRFIFTAFLLVLCLVFSVQAQVRPPFEDNMAQRTLACVACHGKEGRAGPDAYYPRLAGKPVAYLYKQLLNFRDGRRHYGLMTGLVAPLSDAYLMEIAQHFSKMDLPYPPPQVAVATKAVLTQGRLLVTQGDSARKLPACVECHGQALTGVAPDVPGLLGLSSDYLNAQLGGWKTGQRRAHAPDCMAQIATQLSTQDVASVAHWLASQPLPANTHPVTLALRPYAAPPKISCGSAPPVNTPQAPGSQDTPRSAGQLHGLPYPTRGRRFCRGARYCHPFWDRVRQQPHTGSAQWAWPLVGR